MALEDSDSHQARCGALRERDGQEAVGGMGDAHTRELGS